MLLLLTTLAMADDAAVQVVASNMLLELEMPSMEVRATPDGHTPWRRLVDGMAAEMAMATYGVEPVDASVVRAEHHAGATRLSLTELDDGDVRLSVSRPTHDSVCSAIVRPQLWLGRGAVVPYFPTSGREADVHADHAFLVVEDHPSVSALVALAPGDSVTVTNLTKDGTILREWVAVTREGGSVVVDRHAKGERICWQARAER